MKRKSLEGNGTNNWLIRLIIIVVVAGLFVETANLICKLLRRRRSGPRANRKCRYC